MTTASTRTIPRNPSLLREITWKRSILPLSAIVMLGVGCAKGTYRVTVDVPPRDAPPGISSVVVGAFTGGSQSANETVRQAVEAGLVREGVIRPVTSGSAYSLTGSYQLEKVRTTRDRSSFEITVKEDGKKRKKTVWTHVLRKTATGSLTYSLRANGQLVSGNTFRKSFDESWRGDSADTAEADAASDAQIQNILLSALVGEVVAAISPHRESRNLPLRGRMNPEIAKGIDYLQQNRFDQAIQIWQGVADSTTSADDKAAAYYNIGVIREARREYRDAFLMYSEADRLVPGDREFIAALARVEKLEKDRRLLEGTTSDPK